MSDTRKEKRKLFIEALAEYLTDDLASKSIWLQMGKKEAKTWSKLYDLAGCRGYATKEEAVKLLEELL